MKTVLHLLGWCTQGFPRADIDIPRIAADRNRLAGALSAYSQASPIRPLNQRRRLRLELSGLSI